MTRLARGQALAGCSGKRGGWDNDTASVFADFQAYPCSPTKHALLGNVGWHLDNLISTHPHLGLLSLNIPGLGTFVTRGVGAGSLKGHTVTTTILDALCPAAPGLIQEAVWDALKGQIVWGLSNLWQARLSPEGGEEAGSSRVETKPVGEEGRAQDKEAEAEQAAHRSLLGPQCQSHGRQKQVTSVARTPRELWKTTSLRYHQCQQQSGSQG